MPTVRQIGSARFFFYSNEGTEPPHIHVEQAGAVAKFWLGRYPWPRRAGSGDTTSVARNGS